MNYKEWIDRKLGTAGRRAQLKFGGIYVFDVIRQAPPLMIVTRAYSHGIYGIDMARMDRRLRPGVLKDYKAAMAEKSELKRNGRLFEIERKLANFKASKHSVVSYKARSIKSRIAEVTVEELEDLVRKAL